MLRSDELNIRWKSGVKPAASDRFHQPDKAGQPLALQTQARQ